MPLGQGAAARCALGLITLGLAGCGNVKVRPLATGDVERPAYQLAGATLEQLRQETQRLCPEGADVLRHALRVDGGRGEARADAWYGRWWQAAQSAVAPPSQDAQLLVVCQTQPGSAQLAKAMPTAATAPATAPAAQLNAPRPASPAPVGEGEARDGQSAAMPRAAVRSAQAGTPALAPGPGAAEAGKPAVKAAAARPMRASSAPVLSY